MRRRVAVGAALAVLVGAFSLWRCSRDVPHSQEPPPAREPFKYPDHNLVFVSFDALQAAHVGALGNPRDVTPTLDALARRGTTFRRAYSVASWTVPASMTWFTGVYPSEHRMTNKFSVYTAQERRTANLRQLAPDLVTLADVLRANGYATGGFTGNAGVSGGFGYDQGFDTYYAPATRFGGLDESVPRALDWLRANRDRRFFLFLHGYDVHGQFLPAGGLDYRFVAPGYDGRYAGSEPEQELLREEGLDRGRVNVRPADVDFWRAVYDEKVMRADAHFRHFLTEFEKLGVSDRTLFVVTSDHGTELYEHQRFDHGFTLYDELIRVPLVLALPDARGAVVDDRVSSVSLMPTLLELLAVRVPDRAAGQFRGPSLVPALKGEHVPRDVFAETDYRAYTYKRCVVAPDGWKLIYTLESRSRELYDLNTDPGEQRDLSAAEKARADELQRRLFAHYESIGHDLTAREWRTGMNPVYASQGAEPPKK